MSPSQNKIQVSTIVNNHHFAHKLNTFRSYASLTNTVVPSGDKIRHINNQPCGLKHGLAEFACYSLHKGDHDLARLMH